MTTPEDDIAFLEDFRDRITRFLIAGTAPSRDPLWGGSGMFEMDKAMRDPAFRDLRRDIDRMKGKAALILEGLDIACTFNQYPPPAAGGPIVKFPLFDLITDNRTQHTIDGGVFTAKLDDAIGRLQHAIEERESGRTVTAAIPVLPVRNLDAAVGFYVDALGFDCGTRSADFAIVEHGAARIMLETERGTARHESENRVTILHTRDPDVLAATLAARGVETRQPRNGHDSHLRGFEVADRDGHILFFGHIL